MPRKLLTNNEGSSLEAMMSGRHEISKVNGHTYLNRDPEVFRLLISFLRNDNMDLNI